MFHPVSFARLACALSLALPVFGANAQRGPTRPAELRNLDFLVGKFAGEVELFQPGAAPVRGPMHFDGAWELDSAWVVARYDQTPMGRTLRGMLLFTWDARARAPLFYGVANAPMEPTRMRGRFEGGVLTFETDTASAFPYRETWSRAGADTLITTLSFKRDGAWVTGSRAVLVRVR